MKKTFVLVILDGWGLGSLDESNPIHTAAPETISFIEGNFPVGALQASGIAIGLPWEEEGNSEVGHLTLGAGKVLYQHFPKISIAIDDGSFFNAPNLKKAFLHAKKNSSALHLIGLLTAGNVHASFKHLAALIKMAKNEDLSSLYLHLFSDGRDSPPRSLLELGKKLEEVIQKNGVGIIASLSGRHYAMDRDDHWDRVEKVYRTLVGENPNLSTIEAAAEKSYVKDLDDEYIEPVVINEPHPVRDNDAVIFFNFREDSMREISRPFLNPKFDKFPVKTFQNLFVVTMTEYEDAFKNATAFPKEKLEHPLGRVLADKGLTQLRIAETEKYAHVTYFFNGLRDEPFKNEYRLLIPSRTVLKQEENPEMMASAITNRVLIALKEGGFDFILVNYANPDIIAHTGNYEATVAAVRVVDRELDKLVKSVLEGGHLMLVTSDHGNAESVLNLKTGETETFHDPNPVPLYLVGKEFQKKKKTEEYPGRLPVIGILSDVAPTLLELMNIEKPGEMTGQSLLNQLL